MDREGVSGSAKYLVAALIGKFDICVETIREIEMNKSFAGLCRLALLINVIGGLSLLQDCGESSSTVNSDTVADSIMNDSQWTVETFDYGGNQLAVISGFVGPYGLTPTDDGHLYVADLKEGRVIRFDSTHRPTGWLGAPANDTSNISGWHLSGSPIRGSAPGMFDMVHSITFDRVGRLYIADYTNGRVHIYEPDGTFLGNLFDPPSTPEVGFLGTPNAEFDSDFNLWVADFDAHRVFKFGPDLSFEGWIGGTSDGTVIDSFSREGESGRSSDMGGFFRPHMVQVDDSGYFYVVETGGQRVQKFTPEGVAVGWIGGKADGSITAGWETGSGSAGTDLPGGFNGPVSLRLVNNEYFLIADNGNHRIQKFSLDGFFIGWLGGKPDGTTTAGWAMDGLSAEGSAPGMFSAPFDARLMHGKLYVADGHNGRVQIFQMSE